MGSVQEGMKAVISADAIKGKTVEGVITSIAPTANKTGQGLTDTTGDAVFAAEVEITTPDSGLKIGMEAQLDYIIAQQERVLAVPYYAVYENEAGQSCVIGVVEQEDGTYLLREYTVNTGIENDLDIVVQGTGLREGLRVISEPDRYLSMLGMAVPAGSGPARANPYAAMMGGMA